MSIVMTGGGTGGHLAIVRAVKEAYRGLTSDDNAQALSSVGLTPLIISAPPKGRTDNGSKREADEDFDAVYSHGDLSRRLTGSQGDQ